MGAGMSRSSINPTDKYVGSRLRMRRLMLDMSQTNIADALGLTLQQVQKYEKGSNRLSASRLQGIQLMVAKRRLRHSSTGTLLQFIPSQKLEEQCVLCRLIKRLRVDLLRIFF
jgi:transcriptional regulator with XRE-family HTH domain